MKVLILSAEVWHDGTNGGNVLSNIFENTGFEFAQIYCNPGVPHNELCKKYYQMTDSMVVRNFLRHSPIGNSFELTAEILGKVNKKISKTMPEKQNKKVYGFFHRHRLSIFYFARHLLWNWSNWKNSKLNAFIDEFNPDIIFAPCYGDQFMLRLTRYVKDYTDKKVISYISDDSYTLKQFSFSPYFWLHRFCVRRELRKTFPCYSLVYTMTEAQKKQCENDFHANMKILRKAIPFCDVRDKKVNKPIQLVYAGGIYLNRWKTLSKVVEAIKEINRNGTKMQLSIYTANEITPQIEKCLNDGKNSIIHESITQVELEEIYIKSDIALHVESFDLKNRLKVRMSFSTKIVDCLASGCAVMAICDKKQGGFTYLKEEDAALCAENEKQIKAILKKIIENPQHILEYAEKAKLCCERNHNKLDIANMVKNDFERINFTYEGGSD